eukprot:scaffold396253_cov27-Prasinocladus_malaysianus.AAC.2
MKLCKFCTQRQRQDNQGLQQHSDHKRGRNADELPRFSFLHCEWFLTMSFQIRNSRHDANTLEGQQPVLKASRTVLEGTGLSLEAMDSGGVQPDATFFSWPFLLEIPGLAGPTLLYWPSHKRLSPTCYLLTA